MRFVVEPTEQQNRLRRCCDMTVQDDKAQGAKPKDKTKGRQARMDISRRLHAYYATIMNDAEADAEEFLDRVLKLHEQHPQSRNPGYPLT
jgi:hypothetical protein